MLDSICWAQKISSKLCCQHDLWKSSERTSWKVGSLSCQLLYRSCFIVFISAINCGLHISHYGVSRWKESAWQIQCMKKQMVLLSVHLSLCTRLDQIRDCILLQQILIFRCHEFGWITVNFSLNSASSPEQGAPLIVPSVLSLSLSTIASGPCTSSLSSSTIFLRPQCGFSGDIWGYVFELFFRDMVA
jgi:hypothetical protein